jgi:hypothetical protein
MASANPPRQRTGQPCREAAEQQRAPALGTTQKARIAADLDSLAKALRAVSEELGREHSDAAWLADRASTRLSEVAATVGEADLGALVDRVRDLARRRPAALFGGSVLVGILLARALRATADATCGEAEAAAGERITEAPLKAGYGGMGLEE